ncbi:glycosyltransferase, partial [Geobacillus sp. WSUCF1]|uniref:glycosyltransferase n=1 Tax=Geobacillus sp. WSUCF1 TaxID=886559 RepID=UPI0005193E05
EYNIFKVLSSFQSRYKDIKIKIIKNDKNLGVIKNFQKALLNCTGDIIFLSDQDDIWLREKIHKVVNEFKKNKNIKAVFTNAYLIDENSVEQKDTLWDKIKFKENMRNKFKNGQGIDVLLKKDVITGCTLAFDRSYLKDILPLNENFIHDAWIGINLELNSCLGLIDEPLIKYRIHSSQQIGLNKSKRKKVTVNDRYRNALIKLNCILEHSKNLSSLDVEKLGKVYEKKVFYEDRCEPSLKNITMHFLRGNYFRYTSGFKAFVLDLIIALRRKL